jgi:hypothetical protein
VRLANADMSDYRLVHLSYVHPGAPWQHTSYWPRPAEPAPTEPDRIAALEQRVAELEANLSPSAEPPSYEQAKVEHLRALTTLTLARARATLLDRGVAPEARQ